MNQLNLKSFEEVNLLQTRFHKVRVCQLIDYIIKSAQNEKKTIVGNVNVRAMNLAYEQPWYRDFLNNSDLVFCDGFGVLLGAKLLGYSIQSSHRMTCPDYIENFALACEKFDISLFLLAGKPGVVDQAIVKLKSIAPKLRVQGHHGYFQKSGKENDLVIQKINEFQPGILYVGFGMPLQERWILDNMNRIKAQVFLPLGACLDFYTGAVDRGPNWMTNHGFEWLTRLLIEPQRLWKRYILGNPLFFYRVLKQRIAEGATTGYKPYLPE
jgi:N-acetylglucosaminyldiphosphoundecaprenol N-acetyl-beta-D-mannosaminyltransferase